MPLKNIENRLTIKILIIFAIISTCLCNAQGRDSVFVKKYNKFLYYNSDSLFQKYTSDGFINIIDELYYYYNEIVPFLTEEQQAAEIGLIKSAAIIHDCIDLQHEAEFMEALFLSQSTEDEIGMKAKKIQDIIDLASEREDVSMKLRGMEALFELYWSVNEYAKAFRQAYLLDKELVNVEENFFPRKKYIYCRIGEAYYFFKDYDKAIPYLLKAATPSRYYFDTSNLEARNTLGAYYIEKNKLDSAEYYFRSALYSSEHVKDRLMFDALSLGNIGFCFAKKDECDKAITYLEPALSRMLIDYNYELASGTAINLGNCYFSQNNLAKTKRMIDSASVFIRRSHNTNQYPSLYLLKSNYYSRIGHSSLAKTYFDSTIVAAKEYEKKYSGLIILRTEQELFEMEKAAKDELLKQNEKNYKSRLLYGFVFTVMITLGLIIVLFLLRKNKKAYRALVLKNQDWAEVTPKLEKEEGDEQIKESTPNGPEEEDIILAKKIQDYLVQNKIYKNLDVTLDSLSKELSVNRNYLSKAINRTTGKNFNTYINEYRVKEAIKMMSNEKMNLMSIDAIALEVGFGNRISFYQAFKKITGLSPSEFRNNKE